MEALEICNLSVSYGATRALDDVSLVVPRGQIVGVMGHNGAGKSTLLNVLSGAAKPDGGSVAVRGTRVARFGDPQHFAGLGVTAIHQEPALAPNLSIIENLVLARPAKSEAGDRRHRSLTVLRGLGITRDPATPVSMLSLGERQMVDLARGVLDGEIDLLLLDEPAAALGAQETQALHSRVRALSSAGTGILYVSHRLPDVLDICDRIVVLREGRIVLDQPRAVFNARTLASALSEGEYAPSELEQAAPAGEMCCSIASPQGNMNVRYGEIVGFFGVAAGPQFALVEQMFRGGVRGQVTFEGRAYFPAGPSDAIGRGVHLVPADREQDGLIAGMSALENVFLPWNQTYQSLRGLDTAAQRRLYGEIRKSLDIRGPGGRASISSFSGGNRQKHLIARWALVQRPKMLILSQPTQGVDQSAKADIRRVVRSLAADGVAVAVASAESDELSNLCDRVYAVTSSEFREFRRSTDLEGQLVEFISKSEVG